MVCAKNGERPYPGAPKTVFWGLVFGSFFLTFTGVSSLAFILHYPARLFPPLSSFKVASTTILLFFQILHTYTNPSLFCLVVED